MQLNNTSLVSKKDDLTCEIEQINNVGYVIISSLTGNIKLKLQYCWEEFFNINSYNCDRYR